MKARNCCKTMEAELTAWKAIVYDIVRKMEELPGGEKEKIHPWPLHLHRDNRSGAANTAYRGADIFNEARAGGEALRDRAERLGGAGAYCGLLHKLQDP